MLLITTLHFAVVVLPAADLKGIRRGRRAQVQFKERKIAIWAHLANEGFQIYPLDECVPSFLSVPLTDLSNSTP